MGLFQDKFEEIKERVAGAVTEAATKQVKKRQGFLGETELKQPEEKPLLEFRPEAFTVAQQAKLPWTIDKLLRHKNTIFPQLEEEGILTTPEVTEKFERRELTGFETQVRDVAFRRQAEEQAFAIGGGLKQVGKAKKIIEVTEKAVKTLPGFLQKQIKNIQETKDRVGEILKKIKGFERKSGGNLEALGIQDSKLAREIDKIGTFKPKISKKELDAFVKGKKMTHQDIINTANEAVETPLEANVSAEVAKITSNAYVKSTSKLEGLTAKLAKNPTSKRLEKLVQEESVRNVELSFANANMGTVQARALALRKGDAPIKQQMQKAITKMLRSLPKEEAAKVNRLILAAKGDSNKIKKIIIQYSKINWGDWLIELGVNFKLSNIGTHVRNTLGTMLNLTSKLIRSPLEVAFDATRAKITRTPRAVVAGEIPASFKGLKTGTVSAGKQFVQDIKALGRGEEISQVKTSEFGRMPVIKGVIGKLIRIPTKMLAVEDRFFREVTRGVEAARWETKVAKGLNTKNMKARIDAEVAEVLFQKEMGKVGKMAQNLINSNPFIKTMFPFFKTPVNLFKEGLKHTPLGLAGTMNKVPAEAAKNFAKAILGTAISIPLINYAVGTDENGAPNMTGAAPKKLGKRATRFDQGIDPNSIRIGNKYYSYSNIEPFATAFQLSAAIGNDYRERGEVDTDLALQVTREIARSFADKSSMKTLNDIYKAFTYESEFESGEKLYEFLGKQAAGIVIPNLTGAITRGTDPTIRDVSGFQGQFTKNIPLLSKTLPPKRGRFGQEVTREGGLFQQFLGITNISPIELTAIDDELNRLGKTLNPISRNVAGIKLDDDTYSDMVGLIGPIRQKKLQELISNREYRQLTDAEKGKQVDKVISTVDKLGKVLFSQLSKSNIQSDILESDANLSKTFAEILSTTKEFADKTPEQIEKFVKKNFEKLKAGFKPLNQ